MPPKLPKPPKCCSCNSSGMCKSCSCCKNHTSCVDCGPGKHSRCLNLPGRNFRQNERKRSATSKITVTAVNERKEPATASVSATLSDCSGAQHGNVSKLSGTTALNSSSIPSRVSVKKPSGSSAVRPAASNQRTGPLSFLQPSFIPASTPKVSPELDPLLPSSCPPLSLPCPPLPSPFSSLSSSCPPLLPLPTRPTTATQVIDTSDAVTTAALDQVLKAETAAADNHPFATGVEIPDDDNAQISDSVATPEPCLPGFQPMSATSNFKWGEVDGDVFCSNINSAYAEIVHWRRNLFLVPSGKAGKEFILELTRLWRAYASASAMEAIALRAAMVMCALVLQNPSPNLVIMCRA